MDEPAARNRLPQAFIHQSWHVLAESGTVLHLGNVLVGYEAVGLILGACTESREMQSERSVRESPNFPVFNEAIIELQPRHQATLPCAFLGSGPKT